MNKSESWKYGYSYNDTNLYQVTTDVCRNEALERLLYHSNQTDEFKAVSVIGIALDPRSLKMNQMTAVSDYEPTKLEQSLQMISIALIVFWFLALPLNYFVYDLYKIHE